MKKKHLLHANWKVAVNGQSDLPENVRFPTEGIAAEVPGTIHTDLLNADLIEDPFYADNEKKLSWISEIDWIYHTQFIYPQDFDYNKPIYLVFEGLDTIAEIKLNDAVLGRSENMFRKYEYDVSNYIKKGNNKLQLRFESPLRYGREKIQKYGKLFAARKPERAYIRKAQYSFGWDWGPAYPTMGIWRPVYLIQHREGRIVNIKFDTVNLKKNQAKVLISWECLGDVNELGFIKVKLANKNSSFKETKNIITSLSDFLELELSDPALWWPHGEGEQNLYRLDISIFNKRQELIDTWNKNVGIRKIELRQKAAGKNTFQFLVNDRPVFAKGADWIPADSFLPRLNTAYYEKLLTLARQADMNMLRIWGGGIYEQEIFYELCDKLGLMVWQDFMFACSSYPEDKDFLENVTNEVIENILRIQYHPCLVIWCGNNENEWIWYRENMGSYREMPGFSIFHELIPNLVRKFDPYRPYWPTSPFGQDADPNSPLSGNRHQWDIWSRWVDYIEVEKDQSLFVTEFGFQGPANRDTLESVLPASDRHPQSRLFEYHNKQIEGNERLFRYLAAHFPITTKWEDFLYLTQLNQGLALKTCLEHWRLRWPETGGSLIWQLNDCWPVTSWSLVDSDLMPKIAYHFVKTAYSPHLVTFHKENNILKVIAINQNEATFSGKIVLTFLHPATGLVDVQEDSKITLQGNSKKEIRSFSTEQLGIVLITLLDSEGNIMHRNFYNKYKWKHTKLERVEVAVKICNDNDVEITSDHPTFFVDLYHKGIHYSKRGFIILPGETKKLKVYKKDVPNPGPEIIKVFTLNNLINV
jgi:beta-mannosidase